MRGRPRADGGVEPGSRTILTRRDFLGALAAVAGGAVCTACLPPTGSPPYVSPATPTPPPPPPPPPLAALPTLRPAPSPAATASPVAPAPSPTSAAAPTGGTAVIASTAEPDSLDPANALTPAADTIMRSIYDGLLRFGSGLDLQPALASQWTASQDGTLYSFQIRRGVRFHDGSLCNQMKMLPGGGIEAWFPQLRM